MTYVTSFLIFQSYMSCVLGTELFPIHFQLDNTCVILLHNCIVSNIVATCSAINRFTHITKVNTLSTPTNSASAELLLLILCLHNRDRDINTPFPKVKTVLVCLHISLCTTNDTSTLHMRVPKLSYPNTSGKQILVHLIYGMTLTNFL